jgi:hypothetical protein
LQIADFLAPHGLVAASKDLTSLPAKRYSLQARLGCCQIENANGARRWRGMSDDISKWRKVDITTMSGPRKVFTGRLVLWFA